MTELSTQKMSLLAEEFFEICISQRTRLPPKEVECEKFAKCPGEQLFFHTFTQKPCCNQRGYAR
jgi:hypothetical protein